MRFQRTLRVLFSISTSFNYGDLIICFIIIFVDSNSTIKSNELICFTSSFNLENNWAIIRIVLKISNSNHLNCNRSITRVYYLFIGIIPVNLPVLCGIEANFTVVIAITRVTHVPRVISVRCTIKSTRMSKSEIMPYFMHLHSNTSVIASTI